VLISLNRPERADGRSVAGAWQVLAVSWQFPGSFLTGFWQYAGSPEAGNGRFRRGALATSLLFFLTILSQAILDKPRSG